MKKSQNVENTADKNPNEQKTRPVPEKFTWEASHLTYFRPPYRCPLLSLEALQRKQDTIQKKILQHNGVIPPSPSPSSSNSSP